MYKKVFRIEYSLMHLYERPFSYNRHLTQNHVSYIYHHLQQVLFLLMFCIRFWDDSWALISIKLSKSMNGLISLSWRREGFNLAFQYLSKSFFENCPECMLSMTKVKNWSIFSFFETSIITNAIFSNDQLVCVIATSQFLIKRPFKKLKKSSIWFDSVVPISLSLSLWDCRRRWKAIKLSAIWAEVFVRLMSLINLQCNLDHLSMSFMLKMILKSRWDICNFK